MRLKTYALFFFHVVILTACQKNTILKNESPDSLLSVDRTESSRRGEFKVSIDRSNIYLIKNENDTIQKRKVNKEWDEMNVLINQITLNNLEEIKSPSQAFMHDGAPITSLIIKTKDSTYYSNPYDKGNPAVQLKKIDDYLIKVSESLSK